MKQLLVTAQDEVARRFFLAPEDDVRRTWTAVAPGLYIAGKTDHPEWLAGALIRKFVDNGTLPNWVVPAVAAGAVILNLLATGEASSGMMFSAGWSIAGPRRAEVLKAAKGDAVEERYAA